MSRKTNTVALLERARDLVQPPTWYQLAKRTGIRETTLSRCRLHGKTLGDINAWKLAKLLGMDAKDVMAYMAEDRAQDQQTKQFWGAQLPRLLPAVALAAALSFSMEHPLIAGERSTMEPIGTGQAIYYAKYTITRAFATSSV